MAHYNARTCSENINIAGKKNLKKQNKKNTPQNRLKIDIIHSLLSCTIHVRLRGSQNEDQL